VNPALFGLLAACAGGGPDSEAPAPPAPDLGQPVTVADAVGGVCVSVQLDRWDATHRDAMVTALRGLGVREIRHDLRWDYVQGARDAWNWDLEDGWVDAATAGGLGIIAMVGYGNAWASSDPAADAYYPPDDPADFATFAAAAADRYGDRIDRYEIWNEPNAGYRFWKVGDPPALSGDPAGYAALFVPAADAIHAAHPGAEVQFGGTFFHEMGIIGGVRFVAEAAAADPQVLAVADAVAYHPYPTYPPRVGPEEDEPPELPIWEMQAELRAVDAGLPLAITEVGWPTWGDVDAQEQADYLVRAFALAQADGVRDVCVYTLEDGADPTNPEDAFGLTTVGGASRNPSGDAYAALATAIDGLDCHGRAEDALGLPAGVYAVRWASTTATATAIWTTGAATTVTVPASAGACDPSDRDVAISGAPVWVTEAICG
jgi:hypothetical protein